MTTVSRWTGSEAKILRESLRLSVRDFAAHLGIGVRTVNKWESRRSEITPFPHMQEILDTALRRSPEEARIRFSAALRDAGVGGAVGIEKASSPSVSDSVPTFPTRGVIPRKKWNSTIRGSRQSLWLYGMAELGYALDDDVPKIIEDAAAAGCDVRVLLLDPQYSGLSAIDADEGSPEGTLATRIRSALKRFQRIQECCSKRINIRIYNAPPTVSIVRGDDRMLVTPYLRFFVGSNSPSLELSQRGEGGDSTNEMFARYVRHFESTWDLAKEYIR